MLSAVLNPLPLALYRGVADPPPRRSRAVLRMPRWLGLLPFRTIDLVRTADTLLALIFFLTTYDRVSGHLPALGAYAVALTPGIPLALRDPWPLAAWRLSLVLLPVGLWASFEMGVRYESNPYTAEMVISYLLVVYSLAVRCERRITGAAWVISVVAMWIAFPNGVVLGVLRDGEGRTDTTPQPGLEQIDDLVANARAAGLSVLVKRPDSLAGVPQAVSLSAYRIVQESLSNAMRHAPGATVVLDIGLDDKEVRLHVTNGPGTSPSRGPGAGHGLVGMRERATLLGGTLEAGPVPVGGFQVTAVLPTGRGSG